jgi:hypothetical protein
MRGATAPRLLLEVVCARLLLPSASDTESALLQRLERIETRLDHVDSLRRRYCRACHGSDEACQAIRAQEQGHPVAAGRARPGARARLGSDDQA